MRSGLLYHLNHQLFSRFLLFPDRSQEPNHTQPHPRHENDLLVTVVVLLLLLQSPPALGADSLFALKELGLANHGAVEHTGGGGPQ